MGLLQARAAEVAVAKEGSSGYAADADVGSNKSIVFIRTHHTGSTTLSNIFQRRCDEYNVTCAPEPPYRYTGGNMNRSDLSQYVAHHAGKVKIDIWPWHVYYFRDLFEKLMPGAFTISIFREPKARTLSSFAHEGRSIKDLRRFVSQLRNNGKVPDCGDRQRWHVPSLAEVDLVLLFEDYDRSLVLMAKKLGWGLEDVLYIQLRASSTGDERTSAMNDIEAYIDQPLWNMTECGKKLVESCIEKDKPLYNGAKERYRQQLSNLTPKEHAEIEKDIHRLQSAVKVLEACCDSSPHDPYCLVLAENSIHWHLRHDRGGSLPDGIAEAHCRRVAMNALERS